MKTSSSNLKYVWFWGIVTISYWIWSRTGGQDLEFKGLWQIWHPYTVASFGALLFLPVLPYIFKTIRLFGSWKSTVGRATILFTIGIFFWLVLSTGTAYWYLTCNHWGFLGCEASGGGVLPAPSWADFFSAILFPTWCVALYNLSKLMALDWSDVKRWCAIPIGLFALNVVVALPFGFGLVVEEWHFSLQVVASIYFFLGDAAITSFTILLLAVVRRTAGGMFTRPIVTALVALFLLLFGDLLFLNHLKGAPFQIHDLSTLAFSISLLMMMVSIVQFGQVAEKMSGSGGD